jgi:hypothetical protein
MSAVGFFEGIARDLTGRGMFGGRFQVRLFLQPLIAILLGFRLGILDAKKGAPSFLASLIAAATGERLSIVQASLKSVVMPLTVALVVDAILQQMILGHVRPLAAVLVGLLLVYVPFVASRDLAHHIWKSDRLSRRRHAH